MHCKNFSLIETDGIGYRLSPAYDLLAVLLTGIKDNDELAMPLMRAGTDDTEVNSGFDRPAFLDVMEISGIDREIACKIIDKLIACHEMWCGIIDSSFLSDDLKKRYKELLEERIERIKDR